MKVKEFIAKHKIRPALSAGFIEHLRMEADSDATEENLNNAFREFAGTHPDGTPIKKETPKTNTPADITSASDETVDSSSTGFSSRKNKGGLNNGNT
ncbi:MAG: hypothetical protein HS129_15060 [Leptospiraceae bacterium]|nr:hypothetical protein [Leptospiraceae bacterium]